MINPTFSLIVATYQRTIELEKLLTSLCKQSFSSFEVIIVDQNRDESIDSIIASHFNKIDIKHIKSLEVGLSISRNIGMQKARGEYICFPDDDCWYDSDVLLKINDYLQNNTHLDGITCMVRDEENKPTACRWMTESMMLDRNNVWRTAVSISIFLRHSICSKIGEMDASLGVGSKSNAWSGEEADYLIRLIDSGARIYFNKDLYISHPNTENSSQSLKKAFRYGVGMGRVLSKHKYPNKTKINSLVRPVIGFFFYIITFRFRRSLTQLSTFLGRAKGIL